MIEWNSGRRELTKHPMRLIDGWIDRFASSHKRKTARGELKTDPNIMWHVGF
jgi:hypothetical protein